MAQSSISQQPLCEDIAQIVADVLNVKYFPFHGVTLPKQLAA
jgi:hypothetical protein